jgi:hypothetical protein
VAAKDALDLRRIKDAQGRPVSNAIDILAGTLRGIDAWPREWVELVEKAVLTDPYTLDKRTARQVAEGLYRACLYELRKVKAQTGELESLLAK